MATTEEGYLSTKAQEQHAEEKHMGLHCDRINLEDVSLSDSLMKESYFCDLR